MRVCNEERTWTGSQDALSEVRKDLCRQEHTKLTSVQARFAEIVPGTIPCSELLIFARREVVASATRTRSQPSWHDESES